MSNPLLLAVISRVLAGSIPHQPNRSNATDLVRKGTVPAGAVPAHEHLNRELNLLIWLLHRARLPLPACSKQHGCRLPTAAAEPSKPDSCLPGEHRAPIGPEPYAKTNASQG